MIFNVIDDVNFVRFIASGQDKRQKIFLDIYWNSLQLLIRQSFVQINGNKRKSRKAGRCACKIAQICYNWGIRKGDFIHGR